MMCTFLPMGCPTLWCYDEVCGRHDERGMAGHGKACLTMTWKMEPGRGTLGSQVTQDPTPLS